MRTYRCEDVTLSDRGIDSKGWLCNFLEPRIPILDASWRRVGNNVWVISVLNWAQNPTTSQRDGTFGEFNTPSVNQFIFHTFTH